MSKSGPSFLGLGADVDAYENAAACILPVPFERTTSYGKGTRNGPEAILRASQYVELYDEELGAAPCDLGIATLPAVLPESDDMAEALQEIEDAARRPMEDGKLVVVLGGEHSLTLASVRAAREVFGDIGVVQLDAHADLREAYEGTPYSHASVMRRIADDLGLGSFAVGIRSISRREAEWLERDGRGVVWGHELERAEKLFEAGLKALPERVYLTFDLDFFDPSLLPATGTPEPGGGFWAPTMRLLRRLFETKEVVAMDVVELAPLPDQPASDFVAAKLVYKCLGYHWAASRKAQPSLPT
jgi:agmatinase